MNIVTVLSHKGDLYMSKKWVSLLKKNEEEEAYTEKMGSLQMPKNFNRCSAFATILLLAAAKLQTSVGVWG